jgi:hypothetical protein
VEVIKPHHLVSERIREIAEWSGVYRRLSCAGLGKGELVEVRVSDFSPAVGMRLSDIRHTGLRIALLYRGEEFLIPDGELTLMPDDRLLVAGKPQHVEAFVHTYIIGDTRFPLEWGDRVITCGGESEELKYLKNLLATGNFLELKCDEIENADGSVGAVIFNKIRRGIFGSYVDYAFSKLSVPSFLLRGSQPYRRILVSLNTDSRLRLMIGSLSLLRYLNSEVEFLYVSSLPESRSPQEERDIESLRASVDRIRRVFSIDATFTLREGNPVRETLRHAVNFNLLILGYVLGKRSSILNPYTPHILAKRSSITTLLIPEVSV